MYFAFFLIALNINLSINQNMILYFSVSKNVVHVTRNQTNKKFFVLFLTNMFKLANKESQKESNLILFNKSNENINKIIIFALLLAAF